MERCDARAKVADVEVLKLAACRHSPTATSRCRHAAIFASSTIRAFTSEAKRPDDPAPSNRQGDPLPSLHPCRDVSTRRLRVLTSGVGLVHEGLVVPLPPLRHAAARIPWRTSNATSRAEQVGDTLIFALPWRRSVGAADARR